MKTAFEDKRDMETISNAVRTFWRKYAVIIIAPVLAAAVSLSYFIVKSDDSMTAQSEEIKNNGVLPEIVSGQKYIQKIHSDKNGLTKISLLLGTYGRENFSNVYVSLSDSTGNVIKNWNLNSVPLNEDNTYHAFTLDRQIQNSKDQTYFITITSDAVIGNGITVYKSSGDKNTGLTLNGTDTGMTLCYRMTYRLKYADLFSKSSGIHLTVLLTLAYFLFTMLPRLSKISTERAFLVMWCFMGVMYSFSGPLFSVPDEYGHLCRSYEVSYGYLLSDINEQTGAIGRELPLDDSITDLLGKNWQSFSDNSDLNVKENLIFKAFNNIAVYSPVTYMPQALGIFIARNLTDNVAVIVYSGRFFNWLFITLILFAAIKIIPVAKGVLALIALLPMNIHEAISLASDGMVVALSMLMVAFVIHLRYKQTSQLKIWQHCILFLLAWLISQIKIVYLPFILLYVLIPNRLFGSGKRKAIEILSIWMLAIASNLIWLKLCSKFLSSSPGNMAIQMGYVLQNPFTYLTVLARTFFDISAVYIDEMIGSNLAWLNVTTVRILVQVYICILAYKFWVNSRRRLNLSRTIENGVFGLIVFSIIILIATSEYLYWTRPYSNFVDGIQGRYLIPVMLPLYFTINNSSDILLNNNRANNLTLNVTSFITCINVCACMSLVFFYISL